MIGLSIIFIILIYFYIAYRVIKYVVKKTEKKYYGILTLLFFILLPTWDVILGKIYFNHLCKTEGGLKVYKSIQADGFLDKSISLIKSEKVFPRDIENAKRFLDYGFRFYEVATTDGRVIHFLKDENGSVIYEVLEEPRSFYKYEYMHHKNNSSILGIHSNMQFMKDIYEHEIIRHISYYRMGWLSNLMDKYLGGVKSEACYESYSFTYQDDFKQKLLKGNFHE